MKSSLVVATFGLLAFSWIADARAPWQDKKSGAQGGKDVTGQAFLEKLVGDWNVERIFYGTGTEPKKSKGTCKQTMQYGNHFLFSEFTFGEGDAKTTGMGICGFQADTGLYLSSWIDSRQTKMSVRQSKERFNGKQIELATIPYKLDKSGRTSRTVTTLEDDGKKIIHRQWNLLDTGEKLWMELHMTRK